MTDERLPEGDVVFTTTSMSQNSNWSYIFDQIAEEGGYALVRKASVFTPLSNPALGSLRRKYGETFISDPLQWRENLQLLRNLDVGFHDGSRDEQNLVTVVDEAHSLINPEHKAGRGQFGFVPTLGPQAYHIIRTSNLTIFLLDAEQGFRERENTTIEDIVGWSNELDAGFNKRATGERRHLFGCCREWSGVGRRLNDADSHRKPQSVLLRPE